MSGINFATIIQSSSNFGTSKFAFTISRDRAARKLIKLLWVRLSSDLSIKDNHILIFGSTVSQIISQPLYHAPVVSVLDTNSAHWLRFLDLSFRFGETSIFCLSSTSTTISRRYPSLRLQLTRQTFEMAQSKCPLQNRNHNPETPRYTFSILPCPVIQRTSIRISNALNDKIQR